ncbi:hypothetical protein ABZW96_13850 [Nocardia sp. NPDC004168]
MAHHHGLTGMRPCDQLQRAAHPRRPLLPRLLTFTDPNRALQRLDHG